MIYEMLAGYPPFYAENPSVVTALECFPAGFEARCCGEWLQPEEAGSLCYMRPTGRGQYTLRHLPHFKLSYPEAARGRFDIYQLILKAQARYPGHFDLYLCVPLRTASSPQLPVVVSTQFQQPPQRAQHTILAQHTISVHHRQRCTFWGISQR